jgi:hypothetical protein
MNGLSEAIALKRWLRWAIGLTKVLFYQISSNFSRKQTQRNTAPWVYAAANKVQVAELT